MIDLIKSIIPYNYLCGCNVFGLLDAVDLLAVDLLVVDLLGVADLLATLDRLDTVDLLDAVDRLDAVDLLVRLVGLFCSINNMFRIFSISRSFAIIAFLVCSSLIASA